MFSVQSDADLLDQIKKGYKDDPWIQNLTSNSSSFPGLRKEHDLWFLNDRLLIPRVPHIRELFFQLAHDCLGHFGFDKSYASLRNEYYWPNMRRDLEFGYVKGCEDCARRKLGTSKKYGPLHPLPVPDARFKSVALDFIGPLPEDNGYNCILTMTDRLGADIQIIPTRTDINAAECASLVFDHWFCENGLPDEFISDRDKLFTSELWSTLHSLIGIKLKMSTSYHPQTDGSSERSNKTVEQCVRFHVERNQKGWAKSLPRVHFAIMNTVNRSTGFSGFQLKSGFSPRLIPPIVPPAELFDSDPSCIALDLANRLRDDVGEAQDNLLRSKVDQAIQANKHRAPDFDYNVGQRVFLSTKRRVREYLKKDEKRTAKFVVTHDGPYTIIDKNRTHSTYTLDLPPHSNIHPVFHVSELRPCVENDDELFPSRAQATPPSIIFEDGAEEFFIQKILDSRRRGRGRQFLVRWVGFGPEHDEWLPGRELLGTDALQNWLLDHDDDN